MDAGKQSLLSVMGVRSKIKKDCAGLGRCILKFIRCI